MTAVSTQSGGAAPASALWAPRSRGPTATGRRPTRPRTRSARAGAGLFFQVRPALLDPLLNSRIVALHRLPSRPLPAPTQLVAQEVPHMAGVVRHAREVLDYLGHARQRPHVRQIAAGLGSPQQRLFHFGQLHPAQLGPSPGTSRPAQRRSATLPPRRAPRRDDLMAHAQSTRYLSRDHAAPKQVCGLHAALFHRPEIPPRPNSNPYRMCQFWLVANSCAHAPSVSPNPAHRKSLAATYSTSLFKRIRHISHDGWQDSLRREDCLELSAKVRKHQVGLITLAI